jgi:uncharacterized membrane protein YcaP (DUF421 family)
MDTLIPDIAVTEKVVRSVVVYLFLLLAFRVAGKRQLGQLTAFVPTVLVKHRHVLHRNLDREHMSLAELQAALRKEGVASMSEVRYAIMEEDGRVSVIPRSVLPA